MSAPSGFTLDEESFETRSDYINSFVSEVSKLHQGDRKNELRRKESLSRTFKTQNLFPSALRSSLHAAPNYYMTAMVPVLKETYEAKFNGTKCPNYQKVNEKFLAEPSCIGILTAAPTGFIPPLTMCE